MSGRITTALALVASFVILPAHAQLRQQVDARGYIQAMPVRIQFDMPEPFGSMTYREYRLQHRLNVRWHAAPTLNLNWEMRTRLFAGDLVKQIPGYAAAIDDDPGLVDLSWMIAERDDWLLHYMPDRLFAEWVTPGWSVRAGRQRVNWGINMVTNPNDLFNIYSFYDFDYPERPGTDAIRVQRFLGFASRLEVAVSPARDMERSVAAALYSFNTRGYDVQLLAGYYQNRLAAGGGWAGNVGQAGFKGEMTFFSAGETVGVSHPANFVAAVSGDYMFGSGVFVVAEGLYNHRGGRDRFAVIGADFAAHNPSISRYQLTGTASYAFHPLVDGSLAAGFYPEERAVFVSPSLTLSVAESLDLRVLGQIFAGPDESVFGGNVSVLTASLRWSY
jgi:hypothetical protein